MGTSGYYQFISAMGKEAMKDRERNGERMHQAPLGWKIVRDHSGAARLAKDPATWPLVKEAGELAAKGVSIRAICRLMGEKGLLSKQGKEIGPGAMHLLLSRHAAADSMQD